MTVQEAHAYLEDLQRKFTRHREAYAEELIEAIGVAILSIEKQTPKKLIIIGREKCCPVCKEEICSKGDDGNYGDYCFSCGQALDWSDTE